MDAPLSTQRPALEPRALAGEIPSRNQRLEEWWANAVRGSDQLRQRLVFALSESSLFSDRAGAPSGDVIGRADYHATLARWFGVPVGQLPTLLPNLGNFGTQDLGFLV